MKNTHIWVLLLTSLALVCPATAFAMQPCEPGLPTTRTSLPSVFSTPSDAENLCGLNTE
jgi:hypothetical protein